MLDSVAAFAEEMSDIVKTSELTQTRAFVHSFVKEVEVKPGRAAIVYTIPISQSTRKAQVLMGGRFGCDRVKVRRTDSWGATSALMIGSELSQVGLRGQESAFVESRPGDVSGRLSPVSAGGTPWSWRRVLEAAVVEIEAVYFDVVDQSFLPNKDRDRLGDIGISILSPYRRSPSRRIPERVEAEQHRLIRWWTTSPREAGHSCTPLQGGGHTQGGHTCPPGITSHLHFKVSSDPIGGIPLPSLRPDSSDSYWTSIGQNA